MRVLDLFCGRWGWGRAFAERGHEVVGIDLVAPPEVPQGCTFIQADILMMYYQEPYGFHIAQHPAHRILGHFDFICASSPCQEFSVHGLKCFHPDPPPPTLGVKLFNKAKALCDAAAAPYIMENVRSAQKFVGRSTHHCGPFHLWGSAVPTLMPQGISKGTKFGLDKDGSRTTRKRLDRYYQTGSRSKGRDDWKAQVATIPPELANCVVDYAERILETQEATKGVL